MPVTFIKDPPPMSVKGFREFIATRRWQFARTMPENPHEYTVKKWGEPTEFEGVVTYIRQHGYEGKFGGRRYTYFDVGDHYYWTMGAPLEITIIINRKKLDERHLDKDREKAIRQRG